MRPINHQVIWALRDLGFPALVAVWLLSCWPPANTLIRMRLHLL